MDSSDRLWGAHSGIQKAIRRSDLDLAKTCFDIMWPEKKHRSWLKWRLMAIVQEDVLPMIGELSPFFSSVKQLRAGEEERAWRRMIYRLTLSPKQKDAPGLIWSGWGTKAVGEEHPEMVTMRHWLKDLRVAKDDPSGVGADLYCHIMIDQAFGKMTDYEIAALDLLKKRTGMGGMLSDRQISIAAMILIAHRRLSSEAVAVGERKGLELYKLRTGGGKPVTINLPWYVFDMHTRVGKRAQSAFIRHHLSKYDGLDRSKFGDLWFMLESAFSPKGEVTYTALKDNPATFENMWWPVLLKLSLSFGDYTAKEASDLWAHKMSRQVKDLVAWALGRRVNG